MSIVATGNPLEAVQTAWWTRLAQDSRTNVYSIYDGAYIPSTATFPYIAFERFSTRFEGTTTTSGRDVRGEVRVLDRFVKGRGNRRTAVRIMNAIDEAVTNTKIATTGDWKVWDVRPEFDEVMLFEDDTHVYVQGIIRYRFRVQFVGDVETTDFGGTMVTQAGVSMVTQGSVTMETQ